MLKMMLAIMIDGKFEMSKTQIDDDRTCETNKNNTTTMAAMAERTTTVTMITTTIVHDIK